MDFIHLIGKREDGIDDSVDCYINTNEIVSFWFENYGGKEVAIVRVNGLDSKPDGSTYKIYVAFYSDSVDYLKSLIR